MFNISVSALRRTLVPVATLASLIIAGTAVAEDKTAPSVTLPGDIQWYPMVPEMGDKGPSMAVVFGEPGVIGKPFAGLFKVPAGGLSPAHVHSSDYWAYMISGTESVRVSAKDPLEKIPAGATWFQPGEQAHINECVGPEDCVFYVYYSEGMDYMPSEGNGD